MVKICVKILDLNVKHKRDPADDVSARCNPIYVSRVISSMVGHTLHGSDQILHKPNSYRGQH